MPQKRDVNGEGEATDRWAAYAARTWPRERRFEKWCGEAIASEILPLHLTWISTLLLAVFAFFAWKESQETTKRLSEQVSIANESQKLLKTQLSLAQQDQRAWVEADKAALVGPITFEKELPNINIDLSVNNVGRTPARFVKVYATVGMVRTDALHILFDNIPSDDKQDSTCRDMRSMGPTTSTLDDSFQSGNIIFPQHAVTRHIKVNADENFLADWRRLESKVGFEILVSGCIDYLVGNDEEHHQTKISLRFAKDRKAFIPNPVDVIDTTDIALEPDSLFPDDAD